MLNKKEIPDSVVNRVSLFCFKKYIFGVDYLIFSSMIQKLLCIITQHLKIVVPTGIEPVSKV